MSSRGCCPRCGQPVERGGAFEMFYCDGSLVYRHFTCPISAALARLPAAAQPLPDHLTVAEAAALLRVSVGTVRLRIRRGALPAWRLQGGQTILMRRADVEGLLLAMETSEVTAAARPVLPQPVRPKTGPRPVMPRPALPPAAPRPFSTPRRSPPAASPARCDAPDDDQARAGQVPDTGPDEAAPSDRAPVGGVWDLSDVPTALLTRQPFDAKGHYPGGMALYRAEEAELDRRSRGPGQAAGGALGPDGDGAGTLQSGQRAPQQLGDGGGVGDAGGVSEGVEALDLVTLLVDAQAEQGQELGGGHDGKDLRVIGTSPGPEASGS